jgi:hypothetical protein
MASRNSEKSIEAAVEHQLIPIVRKMMVENEHSPFSIELWHNGRKLITPFIIDDPNQLRSDTHFRELRKACGELEPKVDLTIVGEDYFRRGEYLLTLEFSEPDAAGTKSMGSKPA